MSFVSRYPRGPLVFTDLTSIAVSHKIVCPVLIKYVAKPGISSIEFVSLKETCQEIYENTRLFSLLFDLFLLLLLKGTIVV